MEKKQNAKNIVLPHSKAKLDLYRSYLEKYLPILTLAKGITKINLYDIFCGVGLYEDGNVGSPLIAIQVIEKTNQLLDSKGWKRKPVNLNVNDGNENKVKNVQSLLKDVNISNCSITFNNLDANAMLEKVSLEVNGFANTERNLVFIDPYGYSEIGKEKITNLLLKGYTEIVLFLPVMQMYRFSEIAFSDYERSCYEDLRKFINDFLPETKKYQSVFDFINELTRGLSFDNKYFACSHYIEREKGNYYAVFFITSHIYGLERMLEVKWKADPYQGKGFKKESGGGLFGEEYWVDFNVKMQLEYLKAEILAQVKQSTQGLTNVDLYKLTLKSEFLPKHCNSVLKTLKTERKIIIYDPNGNIFTGGNATYIDYDHYKLNDIKIVVKIK